MYNSSRRCTHRFNTPVALIMLSIAAAVFFGVVAVGYAHHGWSEFDQETEVTLTGVVHDPQFEYPHATFKIDNEGEVWQIYMAPPRRLDRMGLNEKSLQEGMTVTITGHPHREEEKVMRIYEITIDDETLYIR